MKENDSQQILQMLLYKLKKAQEAHPDIDASAIIHGALSGTWSIEDVIHNLDDLSMPVPAYQDEKLIDILINAD